MTFARDGDTIVVGFDGDLDVYVAAEARAHLSEAIDRASAHGVDRVVIDATGITFCDSTGLSILVRAGDDAARRGVSLTLRNLSEPMRELLRLTGLDRMLVDPEP